MTDFGKTVDSILDTHRNLLLIHNGPAVDTTRDVIDPGSGGHGKHGTTSTPPPDYAAPVIDMERALERFAAVWQHRLEQERVGIAAAGLPRDLVDLVGDLAGAGRVQRSGVDNRGRKNDAKRAEDRAIVALEGMSATAVAFLYDRTTEGVRKLRQRAGRDPDTGTREAVVTHHKGTDDEHVRGTRRPAPLTAPALDQLSAHESAPPPPQEDA